MDTELKTRQEIIYKAIFDKLSNNFEMFTSDEILIASGITEGEFEKLKTKMKKETDAFIDENMKLFNDRQ